MKKFWRDHGIWVLFATAVIAVTLAVMSFFSNTSSPLANVTGIIASPFRSAYTAIAGWFNDKQDYYADINALQAENEALHRQIAEMEAAIRQAEDANKENALLRERLNLREQKYELELESAMVTEHTVTNWTSSLTLDRGTAHGVAVNDCVVTASNELVGIVSEVGTNWCTVLTVVDTDTSLGAQVFRTKDLGLAQGDFSMMGEDRLRLDYLPAGSQLLNGDLVVTSGLGGYSPADLVIGSVEEVQKDETGAASYAVLVPEADLDALTEVFIIKSFDIVS